MVIGDSIKVFFTPVECKECNIYKELLLQSNEKRDWYEKLLLTRVGILQDLNSETVDSDNYPSIRKATTMSTIRKMAVDIRNKQSEENKEAKDKFEKSVVKTN